MNVNSLLAESREKPISVNLVKVEGVVHTNYSFLDSIVKDLLQAETVGQVIIGSKNVGNQLKKLGIFKEVTVAINASNESKDSVEIVYHVVEGNRIYGKTGAEFGATDSNMNAALDVRNVFGNAELLSLKSTYALDSDTPLDASKPTANLPDASSLQMSFTKPIYGNPEDNFEFTAYKLHRNLSSTLSCQETDQGFTLSRICLLGLGQYKCSYEANWRENYSFDTTASLAARKEGGHSLKSSIYHHYYLDTRNDPVFPTIGKFFKVSQELAGLGGSVCFLKNELHSQFAFQLHRDMSLTLAFRTGAIIPLGGDLMKPKANDKFYLGGPLSLRGFNYGGVGPRFRGNSLGGDAYNALGLDLVFPLPYLSKTFFRGHVFLNSGSLVPLDASNFLQNQWDFLTNHSAAIGAGLLVRFTSFRLELNYCIPLRATMTDGLKPGFQVGIGMHFM